MTRGIGNLVTAAGAGVLILVVFAVLTLVFGIGGPTFACHDTFATQCADTMRWAKADPELVFYPALPSDLAHMEIGPAQSSREPDHAWGGDWSAVLTLRDGSRHDASCGYISDDIVACDWR